MCFFTTYALPRGARSPRGDRPFGQRPLTRARFSIGIDLGTTNTALAFVSLEGDGPSEMLPIPQLESAVAIAESPTLPSFLYLPENAPASFERDAEIAQDARWVIGMLARRKAVETPGRVVHSAKSWLAHHSADRSAPFLPWGSDDIDRDDKISPVQASSLLLGYLRDAWNDRFDEQSDTGGFDAQIVTITVPASFDAAAQRLTLAAAHAAGYPQTVRLLEEPQAALYRWLELRDGGAPGVHGLDGGGTAPGHVLVVDIGGGTSDFSLFAFHQNAAGIDPRIERIAVSEHILLGGDNMDLALAHQLEPQLSDDGETLSGRQWEHLVARCRDVKEMALNSVGSPDDAFSAAIPGRGSRLIAQSKSAQVSRAQIEALLLDGFFPECFADEYPIRAKGALRELGLPYARDPAVTRHLADFLRDRPPVDAVLFNGGSLHPQRLRKRICSEIGKWQAGATPIELANAEPDLAVARGAARFGKLVSIRAQRIEAGAGHAIFLQAQRATGIDLHGPGGLLVCVLPKGAPTEQTYAVADLALELRINRPVRFQPYSSARHAAHAAGDIVVWNDRDFQALPPLETSVDVADRACVSTSPAGADPDPLKQTVPVRLTARLGELGQLEICCVSVDPNIRAAWPLTFNLRSHENSPTRERDAAGASDVTTVMSASTSPGPNATTDALDAARLRITTLFERPINPRDKLTATRLLKSLEQILGAPKSAWNVILVRSLWSTLEQCMTSRAKSIEHEEAWLLLAGFLLRPGFGAAMDELRIDRLWALRERGLCFSTKMLKIQEYVLWRRVAGGLSGARQEAVLAPELATIREQQSPPPELVLLAGSLERVGLDLKIELIKRFIGLASALEEEKKHSAHVLAALGSLLNRAPLYGGPEIVVPAELVQQAFDAFSRFDWDGSRRLELLALFQRAARVVDNRSIDVSRSLRHRIADKLERSGVLASKTAPLKAYTPIQRSERAGSFGESLPPGLVLRE